MGYFVLLLLAYIVYIHYLLDEQHQVVAKQKKWIHDLIDEKDQEMFLRNERELKRGNNRKI